MDTYLGSTILQLKPIGKNTLHVEGMDSESFGFLVEWYDSQAQCGAICSSDASSWPVGKRRTVNHIVTNHSHGETVFMHLSLLLFIQIHHLVIH